jgi:hypothetical protein
MKYFLLLFLIVPLLLTGQTITPIANIQDSTAYYNGQTVTIQGIVTIGVGTTHNLRTNVFIQDGSNRGMMLFDYNITSAYQNDLVRGNELRVTGVVDEYNGVTELTDFSYQVISTGNPEPTPVYLELNQYLNSWEGTLVRLVGEIYERYYAGGGWNLNIQGQNGGSTTVRVWDSTGLDVSEFVVGFILEAVGVGSIYNSNFQILPAYQDQLREGEFVNYPFGDISTKTPGEPIEITFQYAQSFSAVNLFWKTNQELGWNEEPMTLSASREDLWTATIPPQQAGKIVQFYLEAVPITGVVMIFPEDFPEVSPYYFIINVPALKAVLTVPPRAFNPYAGETFPIEFGSRNGDKVILRIFNAEGKLIFEPSNTIISGGSGILQYNWNGKDKENKLVPLGLYICYLEVINTENGNKSVAKAPIVVGAPLK